MKLLLLALAATTATALLPAAPLTTGALRAQRRHPAVMMAKKPTEASGTKKAAFEAAGSVTKSAVRNLIKPVAKDAQKTESFASGLEKGVDTLLKAIEEAIEADRAQNLKYDTYKPYPSMTPFDVSNMMKMMEGPPPFSEWFSIGKIFRLVWRLFQGAVVIYGPDWQKSVSGDPWEQVFGINWLQKPPIVDGDLWRTDRGFAQNFLSGTNPIMVKRVTDLSKDVLHADELVEKLGGSSALEALVKKDNLYVVTYDAWDGAESPRKVKSEAADYPAFYFYNPTCLFKVPDGDDNLMPIGIQIEDQVFLPGDEEWTFAKMIVGSADENVHEWLSHLGKTHLTIEPQIVAAWNQLRSFDHNVYKFLKPHFDDTLFLSWAARATLIKYQPTKIPPTPQDVEAALKNSESVADNGFAVGTENFLKILQNYWGSYSFFDYAFDTELASRGFSTEDDDPLLSKYLYLQDGTKLWKALGEYATAFVDAEYDDDEAVFNDAQLQKWAAELADPDRANMKGFPSPLKDKKTLARCLQTTIWTTSGQHNAVNFPQFDMMAYQPNRPCTILKPYDDPNAKDLQWVFDNAVSTRAIADNIAITIWLLTMPSDHTLFDLDDDHKGTKVEGPYADLKLKLADISKAINERNAKLSPDDVPLPYEYLDPKNVAASIDI